MEDAITCRHDRTLDEDCLACDAEYLSPPMTEKCTCGSREKYADDHNPQCELFVNPVFFRDEAVWDFATQTLQAVEWVGDDEIEVLAEKEISGGGGFYDGWTPAQRAEWRVAFEADDHDTMNKLIDEAMKAEFGTEVVGVTKSTVTPYVKCRHYQQEVALPDGTVIYASSSHWDRQGDPIPALGIYLDGCWRPDTIAFHIGCPDHGSPDPAVWQVLHIAREGIKLAREGSRVEIGCIGGHGRTGMMMAIMAVMVADDMKQPMTGEEAVAFIRTTYCEKAIESTEQEWYVDGVACELRGEAWPEKPKPPVYTTSPAFASEKCAKCNHFTLHSEKGSCIVWVKETESICGCKENSVPPIPSVQTGTGGVMVAQKGGKKCGHHPVKQSLVCCDRAPGHDGDHWQTGTQNWVVRRWSDLDEYATWGTEDGLGS